MKKTYLAIVIYREEYFDIQFYRVASNKPKLLGSINENDSELYSNEYVIELISNEFKNESGIINIINI